MNFPPRSAYSLRKTLITLFSLFAFSAQADVRLPAIFGNHMVLQQNSELHFWGWAAPGDKLTVLCSWLPGQEFPIRANRNTLRWSAKIPTPAGSFQQHRITIKGGWSDVVIDDILFGEVWVCSGQSNMEWQPSWGNVQVTEAQYEAANDTSLRFFSVPRLSVPDPQSDCRGEWKLSTRETMQHFSAAAYFFGRELRDRLGIPVGLINTSWGGTPIEAWMHETDFQTGAFQAVIDENHPVWSYGRPGSLWNGMIAPLTSLKIKGFLWYQGETNTHNPDYYANLLEQLAADWREDFDDPKIAFYYAQIAPWRYGTPRQGAAVRDQQRRALNRIPYSGMIVTSDIGNIEDIHPGNKTDVGKRFAAWALTYTYQTAKLPVSGPLFREHRLEKGRIRVLFDHAESGLMAKDGDLRCFEISGADRHFYPARAVIEKDAVLVSAPEVPQPVAVRFAFENTSEPNLFNAEGLPASCFRTDDWPAVWPNTGFKVKKMLDSGEAEVEISGGNAGLRIRYTTDGSDPSETNGEWAQPDKTIRIMRGKALKTRMFNSEGVPADRIESFLLKSHLAAGRSVESVPAPDVKYPGSAGPLSLTDGLSGTTNNDDNSWQGYEGSNAQWTIDLGAKKRVKHVNVGFLVSTGSWIFPPTSLRVSVSDDGKTYTDAGLLTEPSPTRHLSTFIKYFDVKVGKDARYVRVNAGNTGILPEWHQGKGQKAWMFVDEVTVE